MHNVDVKVLNVCGENPHRTMIFLAKLTQRGHNITCMDDLVDLYDDCMGRDFKSAKNIAQNLERHGTIKRFTPVTLAFVGASRRFLAQIRTHSVGINWVSASCQYSDYSNIDPERMFAIPYKILEKDYYNNTNEYSSLYLDACKQGLSNYKLVAESYDSDTAGYVMPQGLRNVLIGQANFETWDNIIRCRTCLRNTDETAIAMIKAWHELSKIQDGDIFFGRSGPDCMHGRCREGHLSCGHPLKPMSAKEYMKVHFPLCYDDLK